MEKNIGNFSSPTNFGVGMLMDQSKINLGVYDFELQVFIDPRIH